MRPILWLYALALALSALSFRSSAGAEADGDSFATAAKHYREQRWEQAERAFAELLSQNAEHPRAQDARFFRGEALSQLARYTEARAQFAELLKHDPRHRYARQALFRGGETAYLAGDDRAARHDLEDFRGRYPDDELGSYAIAYLGSIALHEKHLAAAEKLFAEALEKFPGGPLADECRLGLGQVHEQSGNLAAARRAFAELAERNGPLTDQALFSGAGVETGLGDHAAAAATFDRLLQRYPQSSLVDQAQLGRGYALYKVGRYREAEDLLQGLLEKPAVRVDAHYWLGLCRKARRQWSEAAEALQAGLALDGNHRLSPAMTFHLGDALLAEEKFADAETQFDQVLNQWPISAWADDCWLGKLRAFQQRKEYERCVKLVDELSARFASSPLQPAAVLTKAQSLAALGRFSAAIDALQPLLASDAPAKLDRDQRADAQAVLAVSYAKTRKLAQAQQTLASLRADKTRAELIDDTTDQVAETAFATGDLPAAAESFGLLVEHAASADAKRRGLMGLAWCQFKLGQFDRAAATFNRVLSEFAESPTAAEAALMRGQALEKLGQLDPALAMYHAVIEKYPQSTRKSEALWHAARLHDQLQQQTTAVEMYGRLIDEFPDSSQLESAMYRRAWLLRETDPQASRQLFARIQQQFPESRLGADASLRLAEKAMAERDFDEAEKLLTALTALKSPSAVRPHALSLQARLDMARGHWPAAEAALTRLVEDFPDSELASTARYWRGETAYRAGEFEKAAERLAQVSATSTGNEPWAATAELRRAQALAQLREWSDALQIARGIAKKFPQFTQQYEVDYLIGRALAAQADFAAAREAYEKVGQSPQAATTQTAAMARWMIGETYFHQENYAAALAEYTKVVDQDAHPRWQAAALLQAGKCQERLGGWRAAAEAYQRLIESFPNSEFVEEATTRAAATERRIAGANSGAGVK